MLLDLINEYISCFKNGVSVPSNSNTNSIPTNITDLNMSLT